MADQKFTPREKALQHLRLAVDTGVRGPNRDAIIVAIEELEASRSGTLADMHYRNLKPGQKLVDPDIYYAFERCRASGRPMDK